VSFTRVAFATVLVLAPPENLERPEARVFVGFITDTECGPDHALMLATGNMGADDAECTRKCVKMGATWGFVEEGPRTFYQLDDQNLPERFVGRRVCIEGRLEGDTILVDVLKAAD
jgi:hypothetical protein